MLICGLCRQPPPLIHSPLVGIGNGGDRERGRSVFGREIDYSTPQPVPMTRNEKNNVDENPGGQWVLFEIFKARKRETAI